MELLPLSGRRVTLRRLARSDLEMFRAYRSDREVGHFQGWFTKPQQDAAAFIERMASAEFPVENEWFQLAIADRVSDTLLGDMGIVVRNTGTLVAEVGVSLSRQAQGCGFATEAVQAAITMLFKHTEITQVEGITDSRNSRSIRLLERVGMRRDRTIDSTFCGEPCREHVYVITRGEWLAKHPNSKC
jgi:RimJ/RimL family protein N-acetyltransferase